MPGLIFFFFVPIQPWKKLFCSRRQSCEIIVHSHRWWRWLTSPGFLFFFFPLLDNPHQLALLSTGFSHSWNWCLNAWRQQIWASFSFEWWLTRRERKKKNLLSLEIFSSVTSDDLFTEPRASGASKPCRRVLSWKKTQLHHGGFRQYTPKAHPKGV